MPRLFSFFACVLLPVFGLFAQVEVPAYDKSFVQHELARYKSAFTGTLAAADGRVDVTYYKLDLQVTTTPRYLHGSVVIKSISRVDGLASVTLDLMSSMSIDSIRMDGSAMEFLQHAASFDVALNRAYSNGEVFSLEVYYQGIPGSSGFGSFEFSSHAGTPWVWSLSEPYGAKDWWPCKDHPADKADSVDIFVTCSSIFSVGSNGKLIGVGQATGTANPPSFSMPIDFRIISAGWDTTVTFFNDRLLQSFTVTLPHNPISVQLDPQGWILQQSDTLKSCLASPTALPFGSVFLFESPAETVTVSNLGLLPLVISSVVSDDSAFGTDPDSATIAPSSFRKFAVTFHPAIAGSRTGHISFFHNAPGSPERVTVSGTGTIRAYSVVSRWNLVSTPVRAFDPRTPVLFPSAVSPAFRYDPSGVYMIADSMLCGLGYWLRFASREDVPIAGYPVDRETISVHAGWNLIGSITNPLPVMLVTTDPPGLKSSNWFGYDGRYVVVDTISPGKGYWIKASQAGSIILSTSPSLNLASRISITSSSELPPSPPPAVDLQPMAMPTEFALQQNHPNPCNPSTTINYSLPVSAMVTLEIVDLLGKRVSLLVDGIQEAGFHEIVWSGGTNIGSGVYYYRLRAGTSVETKKLIIMK